jgi:hypothetical protein
MQISNCRCLTDPGYLMAIQNSTNLTSLDLSYCGKISAETYMYVTRLTKLSNLNVLCSTTFSLKILKTYTTKLLSLSHLEMRAVEVTEEWLPVFGKFPKLESICLGGTETLSSIVGLKDCKNLKNFNVGNYPKFDDNPNKNADVLLLFNLPHFSALEEVRIAKAFLSHEAVMAITNW